MVTANQQKEWPKAKPAPENIKGCKISALSYCDPEISGADYAIIDTSLQPQPDKLVLAFTGGKASIRRFRETSEDDYIAGVVISSSWNMRKL